MFKKLITNKKDTASSSGKKSTEGTDLDDAADSEKGSAEDNAKKNRISMIIRVVVILGIAYFALDEFVLNNQGPSAPTAEVAAAKPKKKKAKEKTETTQEKPPVESLPVAESKTPVSEPPIENVNVLDKNSMEIAESKVVEADIDQMIDKVDQEAGIIPLPKETAKETPREEASIPPVDIPTAPKKIEEPIPTELSSNTIEEVKVPSQPKSSGETLTTINGLDSAGSSGDMASKIVEEVAETPPPRYDQLGRGLVYNCRDKYWACVDKISYVNCNKNMKWNQSKGAVSECSVQAIYSSEEDCAKVQKYNVNTNQATAFCQN